MSNKIRCAVCEYARQDKNASVYSKKHCAKCEKRENCEVCRGCKKYDNCKARVNPNAKQSCDRRFETVCSQQELKWAAIECGNPDSEYYKALLNVTPNGEMQTQILCSGCEEGVLL